jgi:simple sugar transport system ATP-binding protein
MSDNGGETPVVRMEGIVKRFGTITALNEVNFTVNQCEVVGLLGDNGAGKSTLIKVLTGVYPPSSGKIYFEGKPVDISSPRVARSLGIETCYQDLALVPLMSITRNFFLGRELQHALGPVRLARSARDGPPVTGGTARHRDPHPFSARKGWQALRW